MKKLFTKISNTIRKVDHSVVAFISGITLCVLGFPRRATTGRAGEGYIDTAVKILIAVVLGALVLAGLYAVLNDTVMPTVTQRIQEMFNYAG